ncbi:MAG TPA: cytochrome P450, partial [Sphingomonas sp.]|nr:cytochrome P450 [Sphingomonas sp.]
MAAGPAIVRSRPSTDMDPFSPEFRADPFAHYARLRELGPLVWLEKFEIWSVQHHAQVRAVLSDWERFGSRGGSGIANHFEEEPWRRPSLILETDPPEHVRARRILSRVLSAPALEAMRPQFEKVAASLIDAALDKGEIEAVEDLVRPFPLTVFPDAVGMPPLDRDMMLKYGNIVFGAMGPVTDWYRELMRDADEVGAWIDAHCDRSALTSDGLGAAIFASADAGEVTEDEARLLVRSLLSAGVDTTIDSLALALCCLVENPDQFALLRADPTLARNAFEEATRYDASSHTLFRTTAREVDFEGWTIARHSKIAVFIASAGRDPTYWGDDADRFRIERRITSQLGYGFGIHGCVAQMMARLEAEIFFRLFAEKVAVCL